MFQPYYRYKCIVTSIGDSLMHITQFCTLKKRTDCLFNAEIKTSKASSVGFMDATLIIVSLLENTALLLKKTGTSTDNTNNLKRSQMVLFTSIQYVRQINVRAYGKDNQKWTIPRNWRHRVHKAKKNKTTPQHNICLIPLYANKQK